MQAMIWVALGGAIGAISRYQMGRLVLTYLVNWRFPISTVVVNVVGCLFIGLLMGVFEKQSTVWPQTRLFLATGVLGGFTTFSTFGWETLALLRQDEFILASGYIFVSILCGILAVWLGFLCATSVIQQISG